MKQGRIRGRDIQQQDKISDFGLLRRVGKK
jgi:hypothetical protein